MTNRVVVDGVVFVCAEFLEAMGAFAAEEGFF